MAKRGSTPRAGSHASDYVRMPDRRYQLRDDPSVEISRRQWENLRLAESTGWSSWSAYQRLGFAETKEGRAYREFLSKVDDPEAARGIGSEFSRLWIAMRREVGLPDRYRRRPGGPFARFLEGIGLRTKGADYAVGDTPLGKGRG